MMVEEVQEVVSADLTGEGVLVQDAKAQGELERRGYGEKDERGFFLRDYEALFLLYTGKLEIFRKGTRVSFDELVDYSLKRDPGAWTRFLIYRDLRSRGYIAKEGFGFGVDFRVYDRGDYSVKPAKYVVFGVNEGTEKGIKELHESIGQIARMGKEAIIAVIERRGEVIYYRIKREVFKR